MSYGGSSGGSGKISTASDVTLSNPATNNILAYNASTQKWVNASLQSIISALPTSSSGLASGSLWLNNGVLSVVAGSTGSPSATLSGVSASVIVNNPVSGSVSLSNISTAYVVLYTGGAEQGSRSATSGGTLPSLIPTTAGTYTVRVLTASSGGTLLAESASITVSAASSGGGSVVSPAFYVSPSGNDSNAGTSSAPFATFEKAQTVMRTSSTKTVYLRGGTYSRSNKFSIAAADNGTSWLGYPGETPIVDGGGSVTDVFWLDYHTSNITFDRITFQNCVGCALHLSGYISGGDDGTITGVTVSNCTFKNITTNNQYGAGNGGAIRASFATKNNTFTHNLFQDMYCPGISIVAGGAQEIAQGNKITFNKFLRMNNAGQADTGSIYMLDRGHNGDINNPTIISNNYVEDAGTDTETKLFYLDDETSCVNVTNNIFCGRSHWAFQLHGSDHVTISNNIFDISDPKWPNDYYMGLYQDDVSAGFTNYGMGSNVFTKNIVYDGGGYINNQMWQFQDSTNGGIAKPSVSNNIYYWTSGTLPAGTGNIIDSNPKYINPNLRSPSTRDYSFTSMTNANQIGFTAIDQSVIGPQ